MIRPFESIVFQLFLDMLRASGMGLNQQQIENLRSASLQFSEAFKAEAQLACMEYMKEFQANVKESIEALEAKVANPLPAAGNTSGGYTKTHIKGLEARIEALEAKIEPKKTTPEEMMKMAEQLSYGRPKKELNFPDTVDKSEKISDN